MPLPNTPYANQANPTMSELDGTFAAVGALTVIPCTATGTNALALSPNADTPSVPAYANYARYSFVAPNTATGPVTVAVAGLGFVNLYKAGTTSSQASMGDVVQNVLYDVAFNAALSASAGGMVIMNGQVPPTIPGLGAPATQAQMEAATDNASTVTPLAVKWHPAVPKIVLTLSSTTLANPQVNVRFSAVSGISCGRVSAGMYAFGWTSALGFSTVDGMAVSAIAGQANLYTGYAGKTVASVTTTSQTDAGVAQDPPEMSLTIWGDLP